MKLPEVTHRRIQRHLFEIDDEKAKLFNDYFGSVGVVDNNVFSVCDDCVLHDDCAKAIFDLAGLTVLLTLPAISVLNTRAITPDQMVQLTQRTRKHES